MIQSRKDLAYYLACDLKAQGFPTVTLDRRIKALVAPSIWKYEVLLRKTEYFHNCRKDPIGKMCYAIYRMRLERLGAKLGFTIPINAIGPGLCICHRGTIVINDHCKIGSNFRIHPCVVIGNSSRFDEEWKADQVPVIGNNCYIGPGAKLFGKISIGDNCAIGANAVVTKDCPANATVLGIPGVAHIGKGSRNLMIYADGNAVPMEDEKEA